MDWIEQIIFRVLRVFRRIPLNKLVYLSTSTRTFSDYFKGFEKSEAVRGIFGERTDEILQNLKVELTLLGGYMFVNSSNGHLVISTRYLNCGDRIDIYLDLIHELFHIRQFMEGKELFDNQYNYVERPTEIQAYHYTVREARRIGLSDKRIYEYLKAEWINKSDLRQLAKTLRVDCK